MKHKAEQTHKVSMRSFIVRIRRHFARSTWLALFLFVILSSRFAASPQVRRESMATRVAFPPPRLASQWLTLSHGIRSGLGTEGIMSASLFRNLFHGTSDEAVQVAEEFGVCQKMHQFLSTSGWL